jgi:TRAP-type C4-dicarboxylate transport system permease small subunit
MNSQVGAARALHIVSALWTLGLAFLVVADVLARTLLNSPIPGTKEILQNSIVTIAFLQLPMAIYSGSMLRTPILADALPPVGRKILRTFAMLLGGALFVGLLWGTWPSFVDGYRVGEYEGEGSLRVPTWPVRGTIAVMSAFAVLAYAWMIVLDWTGRLQNELEAPGAIEHAGS